MGRILGIALHRQAVWSTIILCGVWLSGCMTGPEEGYTPAPHRATSRPYVINGQWYYPQAHYELEEEGVASCYGEGDGCHGALTATGDRFDMNALTAAHKTAVLPSILQVENLENGRCIQVVANDRGPFHQDRILDLSKAAAEKLGFYKRGLSRVRIKTLVPESLAFARTYKPGVHCIEGSVERAFYRTLLERSLKTSAQNPAVQLSLAAHRRKILGKVCPQGPLLAHEKPHVSVTARPSPNHAFPSYIEILAPSLVVAQRIRGNIPLKGVISFQKNRRSSLLPYRIVIGPVQNKDHLSLLLRRLSPHKNICKLRFLRRPL